MPKLLLGALAVAALGATAFSTTNAGGTPYSVYRDRGGYGNYTNGTEITGLAIARAQAFEVHAVTLLSGETVELR